VLELVTRSHQLVVHFVIITIISFGWNLVRF